MFAKDDHLIAAHKEHFEQLLAEHDDDSCEEVSCFLNHTFS